MDDALRDREALVLRERDGPTSLEVEQELAVEDDEALVLAVVRVPVVLALDDAEANDAVVDLGQRLIEPRLVRGDLGGNVDQLQRAVLVVELRVVAVFERHGARVAPSASR